MGFFCLKPEGGNPHRASVASMPLYTNTQQAAINTAIGDPYPHRGSSRMSSVIAWRLFPLMPCSQTIQPPSQTTDKVRSVAASAAGDTAAPVIKSCSLAGGSSCQEAEVGAKGDSLRH